MFSDGRIRGRSGGNGRGMGKRQVWRTGHHLLLLAEKT